MRTKDEEVETQRKRARGKETKKAKRREGSKDRRTSEKQKEVNEEMK